MLHGRESPSIMVCFSGISSIGIELFDGVLDSEHPIRSKGNKKNSFLMLQEFNLNNSPTAMVRGVLFHLPWGRSELLFGNSGRGKQNPKKSYKIL